MPIVERVAIDLGLRAKIALIIIGVLFAIIVLRLWSLQVVRGEYYLTLSEQNRLRELYVPAARGEILDRYRRVLAKNRPAFNLELVVEDTPDIEGTVRRLATILNVDPEMLLERAKQPGRRRRFEPRLLLKDISRDQMARVWAHKHELPGVVTNAIPARSYPYGEMGAHVLGYIREITKAQLDTTRYADYRQGDVVGQFGIESQWENELQGKRGTQMVIVNAVGVRTGEAAFEPDQPGNNVITTLDLDVQRAADDALRGMKGAVVAMNPRTGEILALASHPGFDPNIFAGELPAAEWNDIRSGPGRRLSDRALQGAFAPGSVFKIWMAIAGLSEGIITKDTRIYCPGYMNFGGRRFRCHKHEGHGSVNLHDAMAQSCDVFFYTVGDRLGVDRIHDYATRFGLGELTGIALPDESRGLIPSTTWKRNYFKNPANKVWFPGETLSVAIGQGAVLTTPIQITRAVSALVNGGSVLRPLLVRKVESPDGSKSEDLFNVDQVGKVELDPSVAAAVLESLVAVVHDPRGTAKRARLEGKKVETVGPDGQVAVTEYPAITGGGKTGTAQVVSLEAAGKHSDFKDHAWYVGFAPAENPEIVVTALVENGGGGGAVAAPVVRAVMEAYFYRKNPAEPPPVGVEIGVASTSDGEAIKSGPVDLSSPAVSH